MKVGIIPSQWIEAENRIDAGFQLSDGKEAKRIVERSPHGFILLNACSKNIFLGSRFTRVFVENVEKGLPYVTASDMIKADLNVNRFLSRKHTKNQEVLKLHQGWILISCSGAIGRTVYTTKEYEGTIGTHDLIRVIPNPDQLLPGYLYAFLSSTYGYALLTQGTYGAVIQHIEPHHIADLPIPLLPTERQQAIHAAIEEAARLRVEANGLLREAEEKWVQALDIEPELYAKLISYTESDIGASFSVTRSNISSLSLRARNYSKRFRMIAEALSKIKHNELINVLEQEPYYSSRYKRIDSSSPSAIELLSQSDLFSQIPKGRMISPKSLSDLEKAKVKRHHIIFAGIGTLGENEIFARAMLIRGYLEEKLFTQAVMRMIPNEKEIGAGYLFTVTSSKLWFRMLRSTVFGTNLLYFMVSILNHLPIPRLSERLEEEIDGMAKKAFDNRTQANHLETTTIQSLEKEIASWQNS